MNYSGDEIFFRKIDDKIKFCNSKNIITHTDFFTEPEIIKAQKYLDLKKAQNYFSFGGYEESNRKMLFFYPEKLTYELTFSNIDKILEIIRITLPKSQTGEFEHRDYLSAIMKFGIVREKFGDIIVYPEGADFIVQKENSKYFKDNLSQLIRFRKANIEILNISDIHEAVQETEEISVIVSSMRIDNFVSEICHCSRSKAEEILLSERVMINYEIISKNSNIVKIGDIITIRGFGRFVVKEISRKTKSDKTVIILIHNR